MSRWRRFMRWWRGECVEEGCTRAPLGATFARCEKHEGAAWARADRKAEEARFEYEVAVKEEAIRRAAGRRPRNLGEVEKANSS